MISDKFRHQLRQEAELWRAEGLIDDSQYEQLVERYQFNSLDTSARNRLVMILIGLGSILIGLGVITFVAANWQDIPRVAKVTLLISLFIGVNIVGFSLWRQPKEAQQRFGHGLLLLGALILGANMGLMGQMFHINAPLYKFFLTWGIGVLAMTYSLRLTSIGVLSIVLIGLGYWDYWWNFVGLSWFGTPSIEESWLSLIVQHMPVVACLLFIPLAYWCRAGWIFGLGAIAIVSSLLANISPLSDKGWVFAIASALPPALLWGYDDSWWVYSNFPWHSSIRRSPGESVGSFVPISRQLALLSLGISFYFLSFDWLWIYAFSTATTPSRLNWFLLLDALILTCVALFEWWRLIKQARQRDRYENLTTIVIGVFICISALVPIWHTSVARIPLFATFVFNLLLFVLAAGLIREGLAKGLRRAFWGGMVLLILRIISWFVFSNTELLFKSLMFILCGVGVIAIGLWFERYVRTLKIRVGGAGDKG